MHDYDVMKKVYYNMPFYQSAKFKFRAKGSLKKIKIK